MDAFTNVDLATVLAHWFVVEVTLVVGFLVALATLKKVVGVTGVQVRLTDLVRRLVPERVVYRDCECGCDCENDEDDEDY